MADSNSAGESTGENSTIEKTTATPLRCFTGALAAATFSLLAYRLTIAIATVFANKPISSDNSAVLGISTAIRTLVIGMAALGTGVFGVAALGLAGLGVQLLTKGAGGQGGRGEGGN